MGSPVALLIQPLQCRAVQGIYTGIQPALQKAFFYIADEALDLAFRLRVALVAEYNAETRLAHKVFKLRHQSDITVFFTDNEQPILIIEDCLCPAAKVPESVFVSVNGGLCTERFAAEIYEPHPAV